MFLARCIKTILVDVDSWHKDEKKYEREALGKVDDTSKPTLSGMLYQPKANLEPRHMIWTGFRTLVFKFHTGLFKVSYFSALLKKALEVLYLTWFRQSSHVGSRKTLCTSKTVSR